jgi:hypothetical protein
MKLRTAVAATAAVAAAALLATPAAGCATDDDCSLNGVCASGACACDPGWVGPSCGALNITTVDAADGYDGLPDGVSSWGGAALPGDGDGLWHLFYAKMEGGCTLSSWETNSACWHATGPSPLGPFTDADTVLGPWCHNAVPMRAPDGTWLVYHIGCGGVTPKNCTGAEAPEAAPAAAAAAAPPCGGIGSVNCTGAEAAPAAAAAPPCAGIGSVSILYADSPGGPWTPLGHVLLNGSTAPGAWDTSVSNVAPHILPNGTVLLAYRGKSAKNGELLGVAAAPHWRGPYARVVEGPILAQPGEDPWPWVDARGHAHLLFHDFTSFVGGHAYARSWAGPWQYTGAPAYNLSVTWANGTAGALSRRERPQLHRDPSTGAPLALYTGVVLKADAASMASFTMAAAVRQP